MKSVILAALSVAALAACGIDGAPVRPDAPDGVHVSGEARVGVSASL
ncbi:MAG: hypothetical protein Q4G24_10255 [Paracoccus sp. (in: a-proteobacteria)]|nr:hypothetical protein [Paracoccus sp. (in: a-proteobacteria)]MDO5621840.1 hypothetical protein [Paracoccus sp. (in: a-proteobacteria)]